MAKNRNYLAAGMLPDHEDMVNNILEVFDAASAADIADGAAWYPAAFQGCESIAGLANLPVETVAGLAAVTSISTGWNINESLPARIIRHIRSGAEGHMPGFTGTVNGENSAWNKCRRIYAGDLSGVTGQKIEAFYAAIMGDDASVTVDRHAMRIAMGGGSWDSTTVRNFRAMQAAYRDAADARGFSPRDMQAITWVAFRRIREYRGKTLDALYG